MDEQRPTAPLLRPPEDVLLVAPPAFLPRAPHLGVAVLQAYLETRGRDVASVDLNIRAYRQFLRADALEEALSRGAARFDRRAEVARLLAPRVLRNLDDALALSCDPVRSLDLRELNGAHATLDRALEVVSSGYRGARLSMLGCGFELERHDAQSIAALASDASSNPFVEMAGRWFGEAGPRPPRVVGLSVCYFSQLVPALTIAGAVKARWPDTFLVLGGNMVDILGDRLSELFAYFPQLDGAVRFEGELALDAMCDYAHGAIRLADVPSLSWRRRTEVVHNPVGTGPGLHRAAAPRFSSAPLDSYITGHMVLPVALGRGCYYRCCSFCDSVKEYGGTYRSRSASRLADDIETLVDRHGVGLFAVVDEAVGFGKLRSLGEAILSRGLEVQYRAHARFEPRVPTPRTWSTIRESGCRRLQIGLESGSHRMLEVMRKGTDVEVAGRFLRAAADAGIQTHIFLMAGHPGETEMDHAATMRFLRRHRTYLPSASANAFVLPWRLRHDPLWQELGVRFSLPAHADLTWAAPHDDAIGSATQRRLTELRAIIHDEFSPLARKGHDVALAYLAAHGDPAELERLYPASGTSCGVTPGERCIISLADGVEHGVVERPVAELDGATLAQAGFLGYVAALESDQGEVQRVVGVYDPERDRLHYLPLAVQPLFRVLERPVAMHRLLDLATLGRAPSDDAQEGSLRAIWTAVIRALAEQGLIRIAGCTKSRQYLTPAFVREAARAVAT